MCKALAVSESGFYRSLKPSSKKQSQQSLLVAIQDVLNEHEDNQNYGVMRVLLALEQKGINGQLQQGLSRHEEAWTAEKSQTSSERDYTRGRLGTKE